MTAWKHMAAIWLGIAILGAGCAGPGATGPSSPSASSGLGTQHASKRIAASMMGEPVGFIARMNTTQISIPGVGVLEMLVNASLSEQNGEKKLQPQLAEAVPTTENGLWTILTDGRMETTWKIRRGAQWHDGTPLTASDFVFTALVDQDKDVPIFRPPGYAWVEKVEALDQQTVKVTWSGPFIEADTMFSPGFASPLPRHLLEEAFLTDRARFLALPYWAHEFVGTGPFAVQRWVPGAFIVLQANERYVLGRPKIDEIEVRFVLDLNTLMTNLLSGAVDITLGRGFTVEPALQLRDQWREGRLAAEQGSWIVIMPQFINPLPPMVAEVQFRRALLYGTDRQQLVDSIQGGLATVAHSFLSPSIQEHRAVEASIVRYEYDPRRAVQLIEGLGYSKAPDGGFRDPNGEKLAVELRSNGERVTERTIIPVADIWTRLGVATEPNQVPPQRISEREYMAAFPSFRMMRQPHDPSDISRFHSSLTPSAENRFVGRNYARYVNPEWDGMIDRFLLTVPWDERMQVLRQIIRHMTGNVIAMGLFYDLEFLFLNNRLNDISARETWVWDVHRWDVKG